MLSGHIIIAERCQYCSKQRSPNEIMHLPGGVTMCHRCYEWHEHALRMLEGKPPPGCQECGLTFEQLLDKSDAHGNLPMTVVPKDGIYQVLCMACEAKYIPQRADLLRGTEFGHAMKL